MYNHIFDTHAHYDDLKFDEDRDELLKNLPENGVEYVINCGCDLRSCEKTFDICNSFDYFCCAFGIHPSEIDDNSVAEFEKIKEMGADVFGVANYFNCYQYKKWQQINKDFEEL